MENKKLSHRDNWQYQYENWKVHKKLESTHKATPDQIKKDIHEIFHKPKQIYEEKNSYPPLPLKKKPTIKKILAIKIIIIILAISIIGFVIYSNFIASHEFIYEYDIGGNDDATKNYLGPSYRISDVIIETNISQDITYRNLTSQLVYFDVPIARGAQDLQIDVHFKDNFPYKSKMIIGARNGSEWNYIWKDVYIQENNPNQIWETKSINFSVDEDNLYLRDGKLSVVFNNYHLHPDRNITNSNYIPIDWIKVTVNKPGVFDR